MVASLGLERAAPAGAAAAAAKNVPAAKLSQAQIATIQSCIESMMDEFTEDTIPAEELQVRHATCVCVCVKRMHGCMAC